MTKKVLTLLLAMVMLISVCPCAFAVAQTTTAHTNVALGKSVTSVSDSSTTSNLAPMVVDGLWIGSNFWYGFDRDSSDGTVAPSFTVDLGRKYKIEEIIIKDARGTTTLNRAKFELWGSNSADSGFVKLYDIKKDVSTKTTSGDTTPENSPAYYDATFPMRGALKITADKTFSYYGDCSGELNGTQVPASDSPFGEGSGFLVKEPTFRYIKYTAKSNAVTHVGEIEIYAMQTTSEGGTVIHPDLYGAEYSAEDNEIILDFSENMAPASINANTVKLFKSGGAPVTYNNISASGNIATIDLGEEKPAGGYYYVSVSADVTNEAGKGITAKQISFVLEIPVLSGLKTATTKLVNVAKNKKVTVSDGSGASALTDGKYQNGNQWVAQGIAETETTPAVAPWATIDLGRRYPIEKIVVFDSGNSANKTVRQQFRIYGSNDPEFNSKQEIYYTNETENITFPENGGFVINLPEKPVYRYIRYQGLYRGEVIVREILAYASVTVSEIDMTGLADTDISTTINNSGKGEAIDKAKLAVDGKALNGTGQWHAGAAVTNGIYQGISYDLGEKYPIGLVELYVGKSASTTKNGTQLAFYASNSGIDMYDGTITVSGTEKYYAKLTPSEFATVQTLMDEHDVSSNFPANYGGYEKDFTDWLRFKLSDGSYYDPVPFNKNATTEEECMPYQAATVTDNTPYRFLTIRKTAADLFGIDEIKAYVINPEAYGISATKNTARIVMNDYNINENTVVKETVKLYDADGNEMDYASVKLDGAEIVVNFANNMTKGDTYKIVLDGIITNNGVEMAAPCEFTFVLPDTDYRITNIEAQTSVEAGRNCTVAFDIENEGEDVDVLAVVAIYDGNKLLTIKPVNETVKKGETKPVRSEVRIVIPEESQPNAKVFIWNNDTLAPIFNAN